MTGPSLAEWVLIGLVSGALFAVWALFSDSFPAKSPSKKAGQGRSEPQESKMSYDSASFSSVRMEQRRAEELRRARWISGMGQAQAILRDESRNADETSTDRSETESGKSHDLENALD